MSFDAFRDITTVRRWALGYVGGRARAYRRGRLTLASVIASIEMARARGVQDNAITAKLHNLGLSWDRVNGVVDTALQPTFRTVKRSEP
jgi:hypothetical protein